MVSDNARCSGMTLAHGQVDALVIGLSWLYLLTCKGNGLVIPGTFLLKYMELSLLYLLIRFLFSIVPNTVRILCLVTIVVINLYEIRLGYLQLIGKISSNHILYTITGSFKNPGPYGGFLAVCISLFAAYYIKHTKSKNQNTLSKLLCWIVSFSALFALIILPSTQSRSAILALGCSMAVLAYDTEKLRIKIIAVLKRYGLWIFLSAAIIGTGAYFFKKPSADGRLFMDKICIKAMCENGLNGAGIGHFGLAYGKAQANYFKKQIEENGNDDLDWKSIDEHDRMTASSPNNAFNEYLFVGVEAGFVIMLLFIGIIISAIIISFKRGSIWCYGLMALACFALFSYPLHLKQFQLLLPILLASCLSDREPFFKNRFDLLKSLIVVIMLIVLSTIMILKVPEVKLYKQAESTWKEVEKWYNLEEYEYAEEEMESLFSYMNNDHSFLFAYGHSLNKIGAYERSDSILMMGTELSCDPMFWNVMGNNSLALGKYREAEERYKHAFYMLPNRLYPLYLLAKLYHTEGDSVKFMDIADKIDSFIPKVESINTERLRDEIKEIKKGYIQ